MAQNQPIRVSLKLPAGVALSMSTDVQSESQALPLAVFFSEAGSRITLVWIKIQSFENSQLLIDFKKQPSLGNTGTMYLLNDSKTPLQEAQVFKSFPALLNVHQQGLLIRSFSPAKTTLQAWIGFEEDVQVKTVVFEYF